MDNKKLVKIADEAKNNSYSPYSNFKVGAALITEDGSVFKGCNIENSSYGATICAERTAVFKAVSEGHKKFIKLAVMSSSGDFTFPCGICLQVISEFMPNGKIILANNKDEIKIFKINELLAHSFKLDKTHRS